APSSPLPYPESNAFPFPEIMETARTFLCHKQRNAMQMTSSPAWRFSVFSRFFCPKDFLRLSVFPETVFIWPQNSSAVEGDRKSAAAGNLSFHDGRVIHRIS